MDLEPQPQTSPRHKARPALAAVLPHLILGTATFNSQYVNDPSRLPCEAIVARALELGVTAFDTSPYYGPAEVLLGRALAAIAAPASHDSAGPPRPAAFLITKAGRVGPSSFDYSPAGIRRSVQRSLRRLQAQHADLVYTHDVEFVSPAEVLAAVRELRRLRDEDGAVRYVGISGYPVDVLCDLAETVLRETGEPLDAVLSYCHFTVQNTRLGRRELDDGGGGGSGDPPASSSLLARFRAAGVGVVLNASILGMGLLTTAGIPATASTNDGQSGSGSTAPSSSPFTKWHPSPNGLRLACNRMSQVCQQASPSTRLEAISIRWSLEEWARIAAGAGLGVSTTTTAAATAVGHEHAQQSTVGATVIGVTSVAELEETVREWRGVLAGLGLDVPGSDGVASTAATHDSLQRREQTLSLVTEKLWPILGEWRDYSWASPGEGFVNQPMSVADDEAEKP